MFPENEIKHVKQVIVWRRDLSDIPLGKKMAQAGHAGHMFICDKLAKNSLEFSPAELAWLTGEYKKIVLVARSEADLLILHQKALELGLTSHLVVDNAHTVFSEPTTTCLAIGPNEAELIDQITGENGPLGKLRLA